MANQIRWDCPNGLHPGVLGPRAPRKDNIVRWCLGCSKAAGRLIPRVAPTVERERRERRVRQQEVVARRRQRIAEREQGSRMVDVLDYDGTPTRLDALALLREAWATEELHAHHGGRRMPRLVIRRGTKGRNSSRPERARDRISGHCKVRGRQIVVTVRPGLGREWLEAITVHEATHAALPSREWHGPPWRGAYIRCVRELYQVTVLNRGAAWRLDEVIAAAIRAR